MRFPKGAHTEVGARLLCGRVAAGDERDLALKAAGACLARHEIWTRDHLAFVARLVILVLRRQRVWVTLLHIWNPQHSTRL